MNPHYGKFEEDTLPTYTTRESISAQLDRKIVEHLKYLRMTARMGEKDWAKSDHGLTHKPLPIEPCSYHYEVHAFRMVDDEQPPGMFNTGAYGRRYVRQHVERLNERYQAAGLRAARVRVDALTQEGWVSARVLYVPCTLAAERGARVRRVYGQPPK